MAGRVSRLIRRAVHWGGCRFLPGGLILGYHRVAAVADDPWHMCVRPEHLAQQLEVLVRRWRPVTLRALGGGASGNPSGPSAVAVTFDDAYLDVLEAALPILERFEVPATVFVVTGSLGAVYWWDQFQWLQQAAAPSRVTVTIPATEGDGSSRSIAVDTRRPLPAALHRALSISLESDRLQVLEDLRIQLGLPRETVGTPGARAVTREELARLAAHPLIEIGAHTHTHPDLSRVSRDRLRPEVRGGRQALADCTGRSIESFAYPHGGTSRAARAAVAEAGFSLACAGQPGRVRHRTDRLALPRLWPSDVDGERFGRFLRRWTGR